MQAQHTTSTLLNTIAGMSPNEGDDNESETDDEVLLFTRRMVMDPPAYDLEVRAHLEHAELCHGSDEVCTITEGGGGQTHASSYGMPMLLKKLIATQLSWVTIPTARDLSHSNRQHLCQSHGTQWSSYHVKDQ
jgi:hypothetical protein